MVRLLLSLALALPLATGALAAEDWPDQLTVYAIPATRPLHWERPRTLTLRTITNRLAFWHRDFRHSIGHVFVHVRSSSTGRDVMTGMTGRVASEDQDLVLLDEYGLGILGADMMGRLEDAEDLAAEIAARQETGLIARMRFLISPEASARMVQFLDEFRAHGDDDHYGGANRPRHHEGGGCSAFGVAFMELGGLMRPEYEAWKVDLRAPLDLYGGPLTGLRVPLRRILMAEGRRWAEEDEPFIRSTFWDPTLMFQWIRRTHRAESKDPTGSYALELRGRMRSLVVDARSTPVPDEPIWFEELPPGAPHPLGRQESVRREVSSDEDLEEELATLIPSVTEMVRSLDRP